MPIGPAQPMPDAPRITRRAVRDALRAGLDYLRAVPFVDLCTWAEQHFRLTAESSHSQGAWRAYWFQRAILNAFSDDRIVEVTVRKSKRVGYTKMLLAFIAYTVEHRRRKLGLWQPTDDDRDSFVKTELDPTFAELRVLDKVRLKSSAEDTLKLKRFLGSVLHLLGAKAARAFRRITLDTALLDEVDGMDRQVEGTADPITLARGRLEGAPFPKLIAGSTPLDKGLSHVEHREEQADASMRAHIECPLCGVEHPLQWGGSKVAHGFKWTDDDPATVRHICPHCRGGITQAQYLAATSTGSWISQCGRWRVGQDNEWRDAAGLPTDPPPHVAFVIWTAYSPQRDWSDIVREFIEAKAKLKAGDTAPLRGFVNETLGETWETKGDGADQHELQARAEPYRLRHVPRGGLIVLAGVDTQDDRWEISAVAYGRGLERWVIDHHVIYGNPADEHEWATKLDPYLLETTFAHESGQLLKIYATGIDTQGHHTHRAYAYCRASEHARVFALKGDEQQGKPIKSRSTWVDINHRGKIIKRGLRLWYVGVDTAKDYLHGCLGLRTPGPGFVHFSRELPPTYFAGLTAEQRLPQRTATGVVYRWVNKQGRRNEPLDCANYATWCAHHLRLDTYTEAQWQRLEDLVQPRNADLFAPPIDMPEQPPPDPHPTESDSTQATTQQPAVAVHQPAPRPAPLKPGRPPKRPTAGSLGAILAARRRATAI